jgi:hypothetical protein
MATALIALFLLMTVAWVLHDRQTAARRDSHWND